MTKKFLTYLILPVVVASFLPHGARAQARLIVERADSLGADTIHLDSVATARAEAPIDTLQLGRVADSLRIAPDKALPRKVFTPDPKRDRKSVV